MVSPSTRPGIIRRSDGRRKTSDRGSVGMCLSLLYLAEETDDYRLVLAGNRDEFFDRPSACAHFWEARPEMVGGMDLSEGKRGGTWLAMNVRGKLALLLNVVGPLTASAAPKRSRGFLIVDFLKSRANGLSFLRRLRKKSDLYDDFTMVTVDIRPLLGTAEACFYTNAEKHPPTVLPPGYHVFGNCAPSRPWKKLGAAKEKFADVLQRHRKLSSKESLILRLFELLADEKQYGPDEQLMLDAEGRSEESVQRLSSIFVRDTNNCYGTRTHTVIIVDREGNVDYVEKTMQEPIIVSQKPSWITTRMRFTIKDQYFLNSQL